MLSLASTRRHMTGDVTARGRGSAIFVVGEAGMGKIETRFHHRFRLAGAR
jgi:hypothetical protein